MSWTDCAMARTVAWTDAVLALLFHMSHSGSLNTSQLNTRGLPRYWANSCPRTLASFWRSLALFNQPDGTALGALAANCLARAVARGVYAGTALPFAGALPAWQDLFGREG